VLTIRTERRHTSAELLRNKAVLSRGADRA
jgi:hypothetical protein